MSRRSQGPAPLEAAIPDEPERAFDDKKQVVVIDLKGLCEVPYDPDFSGTKSLRAFIFPRDKVTHVDGIPGQYVVLGEYSVELGLSIIHFHASFKRRPELLLNFVDHGTANNDCSGISVESLGLPLLKSHGKYEQFSNLRPIKDVVGFSTLQV